MVVTSSSLNAATLPSCFVFHTVLPSVYFSSSSFASKCEGQKAYKKGWISGPKVPWQGWGCLYSIGFGTSGELNFKKTL
jgi:hypothetical protein